MIPFVQVSLPDDCNLLFYPIIQANLNLYTHIVDHKISKVLVKNTSDYLLHIPYYYKLGYIIDIVYDKCFLADTQITIDLTAFSPTAQLFLDHSARLAPVPENVFMETQLDNRMKVYGDAATIKEISKLVAEYSSI